MKDGRLDRICERQSIDPDTQKISCVMLSKIPGQTVASPWHVEYKMSIIAGGGIGAESINVSNSMSKANAAGTYRMENGDIKYL
jgi:hypothetical protein